MVNKDRQPHIITAASLVIFIVLGLACSTIPDEAPRPVSSTVSLDRAIQLAARSIEDNVEGGLKIALLSFNSPTEQFSEYVLEELSRELVHGRKLIVVDRRELDLIRQEEEFQLSDDVSDESAQSIGKKLGAQIIISGSLNAIGNVYRLRIRALYVETAAIAASPASDISASEERVVFLLDGKGPIQVNTSSRQTPSASDSVVYMAGGYYDYYIEDGIACYWENNGIKTDNNLDGAGIRGIAVSDGKVYMAGFFSGGFTTSAFYWVNGTITGLPVPAGADGTAEDIAVSGGKVYAAGIYYFFNANTRTACYWVDGVRTDLPIPAGFTIAGTSGIAVSGGRTYVAGYYERGSVRTACYWVDGVRTDLPIPTDWGDTSGIAVSGGKVYVSGFYARNFAYTACYWVDGVRTDMPAPGSGYTTGIAVSDGKVYVAGYLAAPLERSTDHPACYWVDGARTDLTVPSGTFGMTSGIAVSGGRVYVTGNYRFNEYTACYWVNNVRTDLPVPAGAKGGYASSIALGG